MKKIYYFCFTLFIFAGCRSSQIPVEQIQTGKSVDYTIIYLIHGDGNYLYHNSAGEPQQANWQVLQEAKWVAENAENGEVFIFHLRPERKVLWIFPRKDRQFLYYRNGRLIVEKRYSPHSKTQPFVTEAKLYQRFQKAASQDSSHKKVALYFGHEIPARQENGYHKSRPEALFNRSRFASGLQEFLQRQSDGFDLAVLSTCANGTPLMVHELSPFTDYILASPQNLHLSHIDTKALQLLDQPNEIPTARLADIIATQTYNRLSSFLQTIITLSIYNTEHTQAYITPLAEAYRKHLASRENSIPSHKNIDCSRLSFFNKRIAEEGIKVWYKAPQFGQKAKYRTHSGWGCKK